MSTTATYPQARIGGLLASEARRLWHRNVVRLLFVIAAVIYLLVFILNYFHSTGPNDVASGRPVFSLDGNTQIGAISVGVGIAIIMFAVGTTYAGAEWTQRTMVALLFWEPRRARVTGAKVAVIAMAAAAVTVVTQAIWLATALFWADTRGDSSHRARLWHRIFVIEFRIVIFVVLVSLLGFGIANLIRNSAASFGVGFVYFAILEFVVRIFRPRWNQWLLTENATALLRRGGVDVPTSNNSDNAKEVHLSNLHGGLVWAVVAGVVIVGGAILFNRRDAS